MIYDKYGNGRVSTTDNVAIIPVRFYSDCVSLEINYARDIDCLTCSLKYYYIYGRTCAYKNKKYDPSLRAVSNPEGNNRTVCLPSTN